VNRCPTCDHHFKDGMRFIKFKSPLPYWGWEIHYGFCHDDWHNEEKK
jgi:hypothetical protein